MASTSSDNPEASAHTPAVGITTSGQGSVSNIAPPTPSLGRMRTEKPTQPEMIQSAFNVKPVEEAVIGNPEMVFSLKLDGQLGIFYDREVTTRIPTAVEIDPINLRDSAFITLRDVCDALIRNRDTRTFPESTLDANTLAALLSHGITIALYLKLQSVNSLDPRYSNRFYKRPKVPDQFLIPQPYALAISQLGQVKVSGLPGEAYFTPMLPANHTNFGLPNGVIWTPSDYVLASEYARKIGMQFAAVDLQVKMGSTWWIMRSVLRDGIYELQCPFPEENFTKQTAVLRTLFSVNAALGFHTDLVNFAALGDDVFGIMLRNPPPRIDMLTYNAISEVTEVIWKVV